MGSHRPCCEESGHSRHRRILNNARVYISEQRNATEGILLVLVPLLQAGRRAKTRPSSKEQTSEFSPTRSWGVPYVLAGLRETSGGSGAKGGRRRGDMEAWGGEGKEGGKN